MNNEEKIDMLFLAIASLVLTAIMILWVINFITNRPEKYENLIESETIVDIDMNNREIIVKDTYNTITRIRIDQTNYTITEIFGEHNIYVDKDNKKIIYTHTDLIKTE